MHLFLDIKVNKGINMRKNINFKVWLVKLNYINNEG